MIYDDIKLPVYIINLKERTDRLKSVLSQFKGKSEFEIHIIEASRHSIGAYGLWQSIIRIISGVINSEDDMIIICEDDHVFTKDYDRNTLIANILEAHRLGCDILSGGIGGFEFAVPIKTNLFWINSFCCTQFMVVYRKFFQAILDEPFGLNDLADIKMSGMTGSKMVLYPFISIQKDFGYSDISADNNENRGLIGRYFELADEKLNIYKKVFDFYNINS